MTADAKRRGFAAKAFAEVERVIVEELGGPASEIFASIDHVPIAAASLAQAPPPHMRACASL